jgi:AraC-like DNA-binding protein
MRVWTTKEAGMVKAWAATEAQARTPLEQLADSLRRTTRSVQDFLRRELGPGKLPWREKPRWTQKVARTPEAIRKFEQRHRPPEAEECRENGLTISDVARDLGVSRMYVYRLLREGKLRRFKGRIAESSFESLLRDHPDAVPYRRLSRVQQEWLVLNGYHDPGMNVKRPSAAGLLK